MHKRAARKSCLIKATEWAAVENIQPENCSRVPVDSVPELRGCSPGSQLCWGSRTRLNFSAQRWAGKRGWVAWWWRSSLYLSWCVYLCTQRWAPKHLQPIGCTRSASFPQAAFTFLYACAKNTRGEYQRDKPTFKAGPERLWLVGENKTRRSSVAQDDRWNFAFKG